MFRARSYTECRKTMAEQAVPGDSKLLSVTKVVTLRDFEQNDPLPPPEKWVKCFRVTDSLHELSTSVMQEWEFPYTNHVLLHIDVPNQQLYHLPLLITPVHCIYLVTFDLREGSKALKRINEAVKHIFAFVSCSPNSMLNNYKPSKVLLVGTHEREITHDQKIQFTQELRESLKKYRDLIVKPNDAKFLAVEADCIDIQNSNIFRQIISHSCQPQVQICRCMEYRNELHQEFLRKPIVLPHVSNADQKKFLAFLHDYGFIVRRYEDLTQDDTPVVSRPQYLCELFAKALELSKRYNGEITVEDLFSSNAKLDRSVQKWFEVFCIRMGLVIEKPMGDGRHLVFVLSRQLRPKPASRIYSIDALLVTYKPRRQGIDCFIPPWFFPAFTSEFLKILHGREECKNRLAVEIDSPAHICVHWRVGCRIHVLEQESCIEIGFQLVAVNWSKCNIQANYLRKLQERCQTVQAVVDRSAEKTVEHLKSPRNVTDIAYGFYHTCGGTEVIGVHALDEFDDSSLDCCCTCEEIPCTPMQDIWFRDVTNCKVQPHEDDSKTLKLVEDTAPIHHQPQSTPGKKASHVLDLFHDRFIDEVASKDIVHDLQRKNIIPDGVLNNIEKESDKTLQNKKLYAYLKQTSTKDSLMAACNIMIAVSGNPLMKKFGEDLMKRLLDGLP